MTATHGTNQHGRVRGTHSSTNTEAPEPTRDDVDRYLAFDYINDVRDAITEEMRDKLRVLLGDGQPES